MRAALLALAVGLVLADSSVVTLALPDVLAELDASPEGVSWVLTGYNLVLALAALPAALLVRRHDAASLFSAGLLVFAAASLACALAGSLGVLVAARCVQGLGGAAVACAALPLLVDAAGERRRGIAIWGMAGAIGAAIGPAAGGLLTETLSWEAIFALQIPVSLACLAAAVARPAPVGQAAADGRAGANGAAGNGQAAGNGRAAARVERRDPPATRPDWPALASLAFLGAGLTAALFLLVLLLIAGWRHSPIAAALTVSVMPIAALTAGIAGRRLDGRARGTAGAILCAGGLAALGLLPSPAVAWTLPPQVLIGLGLGLALSALTSEALRDRRPLALHGGWTIAARHAGVVVALALLTPIFTADLDRQTEAAQETVLARILESPIRPTTKLDLGLRLAADLRSSEGRVPDVGSAFDEARPVDGEEAAIHAGLRAGVTGELDRAAVEAFERSFLVAALLAALAVVPLLLAARRSDP